MIKQLSSVGLSVGLAIGIAAASLLAGCQLYFGDHKSSSSDDQPPSAGSGTTHPGGPAAGSNQPPGTECSTNSQCAAGCFCEDGTCTEAGFCTVDKDCGTGFHCDVARASCTPTTGCTANSGCNPGSVCDAATGACTKTCTCLTDADAVRQGAGFCDEARQTCMSGTDPAGTCAGAAAPTGCSVKRPDCAEGQVAMIKDGCYTGACSEIAACGAAPACISIQHEDDCKARAADCDVFKTGLLCTGTSCGVDESDCHCEQYVFAKCDTAAPGANHLIVN